MACWLTRSIGVLLAVTLFAESSLWAQNDPPRQRPGAFQRRTPANRGRPGSPQRSRGAGRSEAPASDAVPEETSHVEVQPLRFGLGANGKIHTIAMNAAGHLLVGASREAGTSNRGGRPPSSRGSRPANRNPRGTNPAAQRDSRLEHVLLIVDGQGQQLDEWKLGSLVPYSIFAIGNESVLVADVGRIVQFSATGQIEKEQSLQNVLDGTFAAAHPSGMVADQEHVYVALGIGRSLRATESIVEFNRQLAEPRVVVEKQYGCCSHIDIELHGERLLIAENSRHRMNQFSTDGELLGRWGKRDRRTIEGFAACCNPVNFDIGPAGELYTAESGVGRVKRYSADGEFLGVVGLVDTTKFDRGSRLASQSCYIPIEVAPDGERVYVMDVRANIVRVLEIERAAAARSTGS